MDPLHFKIPDEFNIRLDVVSGSLITALLFHPSYNCIPEIAERIRKSFSPVEADAYEKRVLDLVSKQAEGQHKAEKEERLAKFDGEPLGLGSYNHLALTPIEDLKKNLIEPVKRVFSEVHAKNHIDMTREDFKVLGQAQMDAGFLSVVGDKKSKFNHCRFLSNEVFSWLGNGGIVDELRKRHITIIPIVDEMIELHKTSESQSEVAPAPSSSLPKAEGDKSQRTKKVKKKNPGGSPSPAKKMAVKRLKSLFKKKQFKKILQETHKNELPFIPQVLEVLLVDDRSIKVDENLISKLKNSEDYFRRIIGTGYRNFVERWVKAALDDSKPS